MCEVIKLIQLFKDSEVSYMFGNREKIWTW